MAVDKKINDEHPEHPGGESGDGPDENFIELYNKKSLSTINTETAFKIKTN